MSEDAPLNPYAPPGAIVADLAPVSAADARPATVTLALRLLWVAWALGGIFMLTKPLTLGSVTEVLLVRIIGLLCVTPFVWLTWKIGARRNWARVTWIVIAVAGALVLLSAPQKVIQMSLLGKVNFMLQTGLQWITVALLLTPSARRWFTAPNPGTPPK